MLREAGLISERRVEHLGRLLNTKSPTLDLHMADRIKQCPTCVPLDDFPSLFEVEEAVREIASSLPAELIKLFLDGDRVILHDFHSVVVAIWQTGEVPQQWKDATSKVLFKKGGPL